MTAADHHPPIVGSPLQLQWPDEEATGAYARRLAAHPLLRDAFLALRGDLGAGKTTLVRHLLRALGVDGRIKSPTYAVVEPHEGAPAPGGGAPLPIWHFDFYRFNDPREWEDAGFRDIFAGPGLKLAEWPQQAGSLLPVPDLTLDLAVQADDTRHVTVRAHTARGQALLGA
ncbi:MAG: hypothetical protein RL522_158 [Pseudomonadota bacterium]